MSSSTFDYAVIGAGIVGLATARALRARRPQDRIVVIDKERAVGRHQTAHNSGVLHAGIYYKPGSLKASLCVRGVQMMRDFCAEHGIPVENCGKVIVATNDEEVGRLEQLLERGIANGVPGLRLIGSEELREIEPQARGRAAIHSPFTAILDFAQVARALEFSLRKQEVAFRLGMQVTRASVNNGTVRLEDPNGQEVVARRAVNCAGLYADRIAALLGESVSVRVLPFRGEYYMLKPGQHWVRALIYPVPDPRFPFLGVHFTKRITGDYEAGPNAVLAFAREGYRLRTVQPLELAEMLSYRGFHRMVQRYWRTGIAELYRSFSKRAFCRALQKLVPEIGPDDLEPGGAGVRAQAVAADGSLVDDFEVIVRPHAVHVLNAPSPAATASLAIGEHIARVALGEAPAASS